MIKKSAKFHKYIKCSIICAICAFFLVLIINFFTGFIVRINLIWDDFLFKYRQAFYSDVRNLPSKNISVVLFDNSTDVQMQKFWPYDRAEVAKVIDFLKLSGSKAIIFDVLFSNPKPENPQSDQLLIQSIDKAANVYLGSVFTTGSLHNTDRSEENVARKFALDLNITNKNRSKKDLSFATSNQIFDVPFIELLNVAKGIGFFNSKIDVDGIIRKKPLLFCKGDDCYPSVPLSYFMSLLNTNKITIAPGKYLQIKDIKVPLNKDNALFINWYGGTDDLAKLDKEINELGSQPKQKEKKELELEYTKRFIYYRESAWKLIKTYDLIEEYAQKLNTTPEQILKYWKDNDSRVSSLELFIDPDVFKNQIVLVGVSSSGAQDTINTPFGILPGVLSHAFVLDSLLNQHFINNVNYVYIIFFLAVICLLTSFTVVLASSKDSIIILLLPVFYIILFSLFCMEIFGKYDLLISWFDPILGIVFAYFFASVGYFLIEGRDKKQVKAAMSNYLSPQVLKAVIENPDQLKPSASKRHQLTILFSDIRGFTTYSEKNPPELVVKMLNEYLFTMTNVVFKYNGTLDKFIGDAIMAFWGAPIDLDDHAELAVKAALEMNEKVQELNSIWENVYKHTFNIGIGINTEEVVVGNIGSEKFMNYTVIGDGVNLASRLEGLNKEYKTNIIISENTLRYVRDLVETRYLDKVTVKGKKEETKIYELIGLIKPNVENKEVT